MTGQVLVESREESPVCPEVWQRCWGAGFVGWPSHGLTEEYADWPSGIGGEGRGRSELEMDEGARARGRLERSRPQWKLPLQKTTIHLASYHRRWQTQAPGRGG